MKTVGIFPGKFLPLHKGHIWAINQAKKLCDKLYILVCFEPDVTKQLCEKAGFDFIDLQQKIKWFKKEFKNNDIKILGLDETGIVPYPNGWEEWSKRIKNIVNEKIDFIFGSNVEYSENYKKFFPNSKYVLIDELRENVPISATEIRENINKNFNFIADSVKPYFMKYINKK